MKRVLIWQAIEAAIELNLGRVEAGAQGEHKIQRGYMPVTTYSCHYILDQDFSKVISDFLVREQAQVMIPTIYKLHLIDKIMTTILKQLTRISKPSIKQSFSSHLLCLDRYY